jgi:hypothetical protein
VSQYLTEGLDRARESLNEAQALRDRYVIGTSVSRRVAAAAASAVSFLSFSSVYYSYLAAKYVCIQEVIILWEFYLNFKYLQQEVAASAGESSFRSFMIAVQRCTSSVAILQQVICANNYP